MFYYPKTKIENDAFGYRFKTHPETTKRKTEDKILLVIISYWNWEENDDKYDLNLKEMCENIRRSEETMMVIKQYKEVIRTQKKKIIR